MRQLKIKDNCIRKKEDFHNVSNLAVKIANKSLQQLEKDGIFVFPEIIKESEDITKEQMVLQSINDCYQTGNVMGFLGYGDERLVIESRFSTGKEDFFFQYLLERVLGVPNVVDMEVEASQQNQLYNLLLFLFPHYLKTALRKGLYRTYIKKQYNDANVKGPIDVARHIKMNTPFRGKVAYNQREYDYDNYIMELIRHTVEYIIAKPYGNKLLNVVKDEVQLIIDATSKYSAADRTKLIEENKKNIIRHAFYHEYRALQQLCVLILSNEKHQIGFGTKKVYGILFDGAWLWEEFISSLIGDKFYHPMNKKGIGMQWLFAGNNGLVYPDFIGQDASRRIIADAKYKPEENIRNKDYLQVLAYMYRFEAPLGLFLYPESTNGIDKKFALNRGVSYESNVKAREDVNVIKHGFIIPNDSANYNEFRMNMERNERDFKANLYSLI